MDYIENLKLSLKLTWEHKYLWIVGAIAGFISSFSINYNYSGGGELSIMAFISLFILCFSLIWLVVTVFTTSVTSAGLIKSSDEIYNDNRHTWKESLNHGLNYWLKYFVQTLIIFLPLIVVSIIFVFVIVVVAASSFGVGEMSFQAIGSGMLLLVCLFLCFIFLYSLFAGAVQIFASRELILKDKGILDSMSDGFNFLIQNILEIFVSFLLFLGVTIIFLVILIPFILVISIPFGILQLIIVEALASPIIGFAVSIISGLIMAIIGGLVGSPFMVLSQVYWTVVYNKINELKG